MAKKQHDTNVKNGLLTTEIRNTEQEKMNIGHETNFLAGQNTKITFNTWKTRLGSNNVLIIGGTGTGKSRYMVRPNVYSLPVDEKTGKPMSFIFTDPKGELVHDLAGFLEANGYLIKIFNLVNQEFSDCYNPFRYLHTSDDVLIMIDAVVENANGGKSASDPHWTNSAKSILNSIAYYVFYELSAKEQNFTSVSELLNMCGSSEDDDDYKSDYDIALDELAEDPNNQWGEDHPAIQWRRKVQAKGREMSSILSTASTAVRLFASRSIKHLTDVDTMQLDLVGDRPTAVFLVIPTTNSTYNFLISMFYPITGANSRKMTADSFREGLSCTSEIDRQQAEERFKDMAEEQKYGYGEDVPDAEPEIHDTAEPDIINRSDPEKVEIKAFHLSVTEKLDEIVAEKVKKPEAYHFDEPEEKHDTSEKTEESDKHESVESTDDEDAEIVKEDSESVVVTDPIESDEPENEAEEHAGVSGEVPCPAAEDSVETVETAEVAETEDADKTDSVEDEESDENSDDMEAVDDPSDIEFDESEMEDEDSLNDQLSEALSDYLM